MTEQEKQIWEEWWRSQNALTLYNYLTGAEEPWLPDISYWVNDKVGDFRIHIARFDVPECDFEIFDYCKNLPFLFDIKIKISIFVRLIFQSKMPPFGINTLKSGFYHCIMKNF